MRLHRRIVRRLAVASAATLMLASPAVAQADKRVALVIGNGKYAHATELPNPANDARAVAKALGALGFEVVQGVDLGHGEMQAMLREFLGKAATARVALLFYAGHGLQVDGRNYLVPVDAKLDTASDLNFGTVELDKVLASLDDPSRANIVILDACRDNPLARSFAAKSRSAAVGAGLAAYTSLGTGSLIAFATAPGKVAADGQGANSPFTESLVRHLATAGLEVRQMLTRVRNDVAAATGDKQIPWDNSSLRGDVYLAGRSIAVEPKGATTPQPAAPALAADEVFWLTIKDAKVAALFEQFVASFPASRHIGEARARLKELGETKVAVGTFPPQPSAPAARQYKPGETFKDCDVCPEMMVVPAGSFMMGSPVSDKNSGTNESPQHRVTIAKPFAAGKFEITFADWDACVADGGCDGYRPDDYDWGRGNRPVIKVSWDDAEAYVAWLGRKAGRAYRLLSEAEWEYVARAGTTTAFFTGQTITAKQANFNPHYTPLKGPQLKQYPRKTAPVGSFAPNAFGLHDMHGNVSEWVQDCSNDSYLGAPTDGSAWTSGDCGKRVKRGGSWMFYANFIRSAARIGLPTDHRDETGGLRVARTLTP